MESQFGEFHFGASDPVSEPDQVLDELVRSIIGESMETVTSIEVRDWAEALGELHREQTERACELAEELPASVIRPLFAWMLASASNDKLVTLLREAFPELNAPPN